MADNVTLPGTGAVVATEEIASKHLQRIKLAIGDFDVDGGDVSDGNPMPVIDSIGRALLRVIAEAARSPPNFNKSTGRDAVSAVIESGTITTVTTVTSVTGVASVTTVNTVQVVGNLAAIGGVDPRSLVMNQNYAAWAACCRSRIS